MWPWEHLAVGYVCYSLVSRLFVGRSPRAAEAVAVAVASQLPDLVDKPLAWSFDVLPSGISLAHSVFAAVPGSIAAIAVAARYRRAPVGVAVAIGWLSHLVTDVLYPIALGGRPRPGVVFWPLVPASSSRMSGALEHVARYAGRYVEFLFSPDGAVYLAFETTLLLVAVGLWIADGAPGLPLSRLRNERTVGPDEIES